MLEHAKYPKFKKLMYGLTTLQEIDGCAEITSLGNGLAVMSQNFEQIPEDIVLRLRENYWVSKEPSIWVFYF